MRSGAGRLPWSLLDPQLHQGNNEVSPEAAACQSDTGWLVDRLVEAFGFAKRGEPPSVDLQNVMHLPSH